MQSVSRWYFLALAMFSASGLPVAAQNVTGQNVTGQSATGQSLAVPRSSMSAAALDYRLGVNDRVTVSVYGEDDLSREYVVSPAGGISIPLIGDVVAQGRTADDLRTEIQNRLGDGFLNNPIVTVAVTGFRNFYILGEVNKPGEYAYEPGLTVTQAVAEAAGFTYRAAKRYAFVKHEGETKETRLLISPDMLVRPGDTIRLGERYF